MAQGLILSLQTGATIARLPLSTPKWQNPIFNRHFYCLHIASTRLFCCKSSLVQDQIDLAQYKESFSRRMDMAGLKPHHRIAIGVSGGPDSMALCLLTAAWKTEGPDAVGKSGGVIDGLLAIVVDHGLRAESKAESCMVSRRVSEMDARLPIVVGHMGDLNRVICKKRQGTLGGYFLSKLGTTLRYQKLQNICIQHQTHALLIAHHADDQAELFILRLSRNSGVLGLAGMAFISQIFSSSSHYGEDSKNEGILVVRPLLHFYKEDMYKVCQAGGLEWVEDPTNQSPLYVRNRIRMSLKELSSCAFKSELQAIISACQRTRSFVDQICWNLIDQTVTLKHEGYAIIDLKILNPSKIMDICLAKFIALVLQFISQRHRPVRGSTSKLLLDYIRRFPCKTSLTAAGCYLSPAPGSKGTKVVVSCSVDCPLPSKVEFTCICSDVERQYVPSELEKIIAVAKSHSKHLIPDASNVFFLESTSESILSEAKRLKLISESTYRNIVLLQRNEVKNFKAKTKDDSKEVQSIMECSSESFQPGQICYFMNRFLVTWKPPMNVPESWYHLSLSCKADHDIGAQVRTMAESDWLYLAELSKWQSSDDLHRQIIYTARGMEQVMEKRSLYVDYLKFSVKRSLMKLSSIPVAARRSLPVLVNYQGQLLSIPSIGFKICPCFEVSCVFKPRVPLGGGHSSYT